MTLISRFPGGVLLVLLALGSHGCKDISGDVLRKADRQPEAVMKVVRGARYQLQYAMFVFNQESGLISDEFMNPSGVGKVMGFFDLAIALDSRYLPDLGSGNAAQSSGVSDIESYKLLQTVRSASRLGRLMLTHYVDANTDDLQGELFLYEAMAEIMLADLYCSGIPLSTIELTTDYTYHAGALTRDVYQNALRLLDSVRVLRPEGDSMHIAARILSARASLNLGDYDGAARFADGVATNFNFSVPILRAGASRNFPNGMQWATSSINRTLTSGNFRTTGGWAEFAVANSKGGVGLMYVEPRDPRIHLDSMAFSPGTGFPSVVIYYPSARTALSVTNGIEARLIVAEAMARRGEVGYLSVLNALRTDGTVRVSGTDMVYNAGEGGVDGLAPLPEPSVSSGPDAIRARVDLVVRERAFWLFFMGRRQGDLRRLVRNDRRSIDVVYPAGAYPAGTGRYGEFIDVPIPSQERFNPKFAGGCIWRDA